MAPYSSSSNDIPMGTQPEPFHFVLLAASGPPQPMVTQPLIHLVQGQGAAPPPPPAVTNQPNAAVGDPVNLQLELCRGDYWNFTKKLSKADVNGSCRLLLPRGFVENHIFASMDPSFAERCRTIGESIQVWDADEGSQYQLRLKKRNDNASFVLTGNWRPNFVTRKKLIEGDELGLTWDGSMLIMKLHKKN